MATEYKLSYTAAEINERLGKVENLAEKSELPTKTSDLTNDSGFTTENYVQNYAQPKGDYALNSEIDDVVKYAEQTLTDAQKAQARANIGAAAVGENGGDDCDLPEVTESDNGAFLRVVNGVWAAVTLPSAEEATF